MKPDTRIVHAEPAAWDPFRATSVPIYQTATFEQDGDGLSGPYDYTRSGNPTRAALESQVAALEGAAHGFAFASGMAAITAVTRINPFGRVLAGSDLYGGTHRLLSRVLAPRGVRVEYVPTTDLDAVRRALAAGPALVLVETPSNPRLRVTDLAALGEIVRGAGGLLVVDNSLLSPYLQRPLELGAHVVVHSATKVLSGHGDVTAGVVVLNDDGLAAELAFIQNAEGAGLAPFESWLLLRGMQTLAVRQERQETSARRVAGFLAEHPAVRRVHYPGLPGDPGWDLQLRQARGAGCLVSFETGSLARSRRILAGVELFTVSVSFGCVTSLISLPAAMSHASIAAEDRGRLGLAEDLVRISVGIEDGEDLVADLAGALVDGSSRPTAAARSLSGCSTPPD